jgi:hypothetical protein
MTDESQRTRAIMITGPFYDWEIELFAKLVRHCEQSRPDQTFSLAIRDDVDQGIAEAIKLVERIFPERETQPHDAIRNVDQCVAEAIRVVESFFPKRKEDLN